MKSKEFDDIVRQKFESARLPYNHENWQKLSAALDKKKERNVRLLLWPLASIAASVAMAIGIFTWVNRDEKAVVETKTQQTVNTPEITNPAPVSPAQIPDATQGEVAQAQKPQAQEQYISEPLMPNPPNKIIAQKTVEQQEKKPAQQAVPVMNQTPVAIQATNDQVGTYRAEKELVAAAKDTKPRSIAMVNNNNNTFYEEVVTRRDTRNQFITMAGGLNYGTMNSGYVMGFSAGTKLGNSKFYVESDVAFVGNIANEKNKQTFKTKSSAFGKSTSYNTSTVTVQRFYNLYYAQVTPTLGYHVARSISVGVGADVQKLLINDILVTETDNPDEAKQLPVYDMGLVGKTEYSLTKEIKASVYYRKAMNQPLTGNSKLLNRDYLQLQLKFTIFNR